MQRDRIQALNGVLVADAASMGLHWMYDQEQITRIASSGGLLFRAADENHFTDQKAFFAHSGKKSGDLSHYGEQVRVAASVALSKTGYSNDDYRQAFMAAFGPCGEFVGYADRPTKSLIAKILVEGDEITDPSGLDDDQHPALAAVPGLFAANNGAQVNAAVSVISINALATEAASVLLHCLEELANGKELTLALQNSADEASGELQQKLNEAMAWSSYDPLVVTEHFGLPCHLLQGMPVVWHLLQHASSFEQCVLDNIRGGGDTCGRAIALGAIAGMAFDIPESMSAKVNVPLFS